MKRLWIDIEGDIYDMWHLKTAEKDEEYNETRGGMDYLIILNREAAAADVKNKVYCFTDIDARDEVLYRVKEAILNSPGNYFVGETDGAIDDEDIKPSRINIDHKKDREDLDDGDDEDEDAEWINEEDEE